MTLDDDDRGLRAREYVGRARDAASPRLGELATAGVNFKLNFRQLRLSKFYGNILKRGVQALALAIYNL